MKLCGYAHHQGTYTPLWGVSTLLLKLEIVWKIDMTYNEVLAYLDRLQMHKMVNCAEPCPIGWKTQRMD